MLQHPPLPLAGVSTGMQRGRQQNDSLVWPTARSCTPKNNVILGGPAELVNPTPAGGFVGTLARAAALLPPAARSPAPTPTPVRGPNLQFGTPAAVTAR